MGIMRTPMQAKSVPPQWYVSFAKSCVVKSGNAVPMMLPGTQEDGEERRQGQSRVMKMAWHSERCCTYGSTEAVLAIVLVSRERWVGVVKARFE